MYMCLKARCHCYGPRAFVFCIYQHVQCHRNNIKYITMLRILSERIYAVYSNNDV
jgi:hypothetical protein